MNFITEITLSTCCTNDASVKNKLQMLCHAPLRTQLAYYHQLTRRLLIKKSQYTRSVQTDGRPYTSASKIARVSSQSADTGL